MSKFVDAIIKAYMRIMILLHATIDVPVRTPVPVPVAGGGSWELLLQNAGIASMHAAVTHYGNVILLDRTNIGPSQINGTKCRDNPNDLTLKHDCTAHSVLFSPGRAGTPSSVRPLFIYTDTWCSSGQFLPDGTMLQTGGDYDGLYKIRRFTPCPDTNPTCDWVEDPNVELQDPRWYATNQLLPDGSQIVIGGRNAFTYEFIPAAGRAPVLLKLLQDANDAQNDNMYPYVHLLPDGTLFIFANRDSIIYDYKTATVVKSFPTIPGEPRNYPSAGSSVMLPLTAADGYVNVEVLVCGGAQPNCFINPAPAPEASHTCGRITVTSANPTWAMENMPMPRTMGDMFFLANGDVIMINGAQNGCQGWGNAKNPNLHPVVYKSEAPSGSRFFTQNPTTIPRVYHSTANLLPDGRVLVAGSNTHHFYTFAGDFPTELRVEAFSPSYLDASNDGFRPSIVAVPEKVVHGQDFALTVSAPKAAVAPFGVSLASAPFTTHSYSQGLRFLRLAVKSTTKDGDNFVVTVTAPPNGNVAPPSYYMLFVENQGIPSSASWVKVIAA